jgi:hypothetical protein
LISKHNGSLVSLLTSVYTEHEWLPWKFSMCPREYWSNIENQKKYVEWAGKQLNIKEYSDWYKVPARVEKMAGKLLIEQ